MSKIPKRMRTRPVKVRMVNMEWFYRDKNSFFEFARQLTELPDEAYSSEFISCVLDQFWKPTKNEIIYFSVVPNTLLMILTLMVFFNALKEDSLSLMERSPDESTGLWISLAIVCFFSHSFFLYKHLRYLYHRFRTGTQAA